MPADEPGATGELVALLQLARAIVRAEQGNYCGCETRMAFPMPASALGCVTSIFDSRRSEPSVNSGRSPRGFQETPLQCAGQRTRFRKWTQITLVSYVSQKCLKHGHGCDVARLGGADEYPVASHGQSPRQRFKGEHVHGFNGKVRGHRGASALRWLPVRVTRTIRQVATPVEIASHRNTT